MHIISDRALYLTQDEKTVVEKGDPRAASLLVGAGCPIDTDRLAALGIHAPHDGTGVVPTTLIVPVAVTEADATPAKPVTLSIVPSAKPAPAPAPKPAEPSKVTPAAPAK